MHRRSMGKTTAQERLEENGLEELKYSRRTAGAGARGARRSG